MDFKEEAERLLLLLELEGVDRRKIEQDLGKSKFYVDQILSKGSNKKFVAALNDYYNNKKYLPPQLMNEDRAVIQMLLLEVAKLKAKIYGMTVNDAIDELKQNTSLIKRDMNG